MKRLLSLMLACVLLLSCVPVAFAGEERGQKEAKALYDLDLFKGTGTDKAGQPIFELDRAPNRFEAVTMLVRLLGKEEEAKAGKWKTPFTDVDDWAKPYVGYAYANGLTSGTGKTTYGGTAPVTAAQYLTFVLRALGYDDKAGDFAWDAPWTLADSIGLTDGSYNAQTRAFLRGDTAILSHAALSVRLKGSGQTLKDLIFPKSTMTKEAYWQRKLTDSEIASLKNADLQTLQKRISTLGDAVAFMDSFNRRVALQGNDRSYDPAQALDVLRKHPDGQCATHTYTDLAGYLLMDDQPAGKLVLASVLGTPSNQLGGNYWLINGLALPVQEGYYIVTPFAHTKTDRNHDEPSGLVECTVADMTQLQEKLKPLDVGNGNLIEGIFVAEPGQKLTFAMGEPGSFTVTRGKANCLYALTAGEKADLVDQWRQQRIKTAWATVDRTWDEKLISGPLAPTLTREQAAALYGKDLKTVAGQVKTLGDVLYYMVGAGFRRFGGDLQARIDGLGFTWHFNYSPAAVLAHNYGNCGGCAGLTAALLEGDYPAVGQIGLTGAREYGGGHVINWIYDGTRYYVFDMQSFAAYYRVDSMGMKTGKTLQEAALNWVDPDRYWMMYAYQAFDGDAPGADTRISDRYKDNAVILLETPEEGYVYQWITVPQKHWDIINRIRSTVRDFPLTQIPEAAETEERPDAPADQIPQAAQRYFARKLTDEQITELKNADLSTLQKGISTLGDAIALLDSYMDQPDRTFYGGNGNRSRYSPQGALEDLRDNNTATNTCTDLTAFLLADDAPDARAVMASVIDEEGEYCFLTGLALPMEGGWFLTTPAAYCSTEGSRQRGFANCTVSRLTGLEQQLTPSEWGKGLPIEQIFLVSPEQSAVEFREKAPGRLTVTEGKAELVYSR